MRWHTEAPDITAEVVVEGLIASAGNDLGRYPAHRAHAGAAAGEGAV
jgi:hypothetical protein